MGRMYLRSMQPLQGGYLPVMLLLLFAPATSSAEDWFVGPRLGTSTFTGGIGFEIQRKAWGLNWGVRPNEEVIGLRYYFKPQVHSYFVGGFYHYFFRAQRVGFLRVRRENTENTLGVGGGRRWRWGSGWDLSLGLSTAIEKRTVESPSIGARIRRTELQLWLDFNFGYSF